ncbi:30S ribosomal protein S27ae [Candidatus Woesearchaeota archaeon]|nr:30S ribosomal protein S27ae [Candidatus Woesearchaeota archaeon]
MVKQESRPKPETKKGGGAKARKEGQKEDRKLSALYESSGEKVARKNRFCPKCGPGTFLGKHKDRLVCGRCRYVEYQKTI